MKAPKIDKRIYASFPYESLQGKKAVEEINSVQTIMNNTPLNWWFSAGTVLGIIREEQKISVVLKLNKSNNYYTVTT